MFYPIILKLIKTVCKKHNSPFYGVFIQSFFEQLVAKQPLENTGSVSVCKASFLYEL